MASVELDLSKLMGFRILEDASEVAVDEGPVVLGGKIAAKLGEKAGVKLGLKEVGPSRAVLSMKIGVKDGAKTD